MEELIGQTFGPYTITERIGEGGMAVVYKGYQETLNRYVAIKVLRRELSGDKEFVARFQQEARAVAALNHPNILHVYDAGKANDRYYIAMAYVEGGTLKDLLRRGPLDVESACSVGSQMADALDYAHRRGLIHRDVKPSNVLITTDGRPLLTDFGIAKAVYEAQQLTRTGISIGTPEYMAPEQASEQSADGRTDIYALGILLYEMLTGHVPFSADTPLATLYMQVHRSPPPLRQVDGNIPAWLEEIVNKALAKDPDHRYARAGELAAALRKGCQIPEPPTRPLTPVGVPMPVQPRRRSRLVPILLAIILPLLVVTVAGAAYLFLGGSDDKPGGDRTRVVVTSVVTSVITGEAAEEETTTATATATTTPSGTPSDTPTSTATGTATRTATTSVTPTPSPSTTSTPSRTPTRKPTSTPSRTATVAAAPTKPPPTQPPPTQPPPTQPPTQQPTQPPPPPTKPPPPPTDPPPPPTDPPPPPTDPPPPTEEPTKPPPP